MINGVAVAARKGSPDYTGAYATVREGGSEDVLTVAWRSFALASLDTVDQLLGIYMDVVYPMFPLFHGPELWSRIKKREHLTNRSFFASIMGACALASARARDGAVDGGHGFDRNGREAQAEIYFSAAQDAIFKDLHKAQGVGYMKACGLLALTAIQFGQISMLHQYLGHFCTLSAMQQFHDENHWPEGLTPVEKEERRRLYWSMYTLDVYQAVVFNGILKFQETHANVRYPSEVDDETLSGGVLTPTSELNWFQGWNFATDLYRVLEHSIKRVRRNEHHGEGRFSIVRLLVTDGIPEEQVMENLLGLYNELPDRFKEYSVPSTGDKAKDLFGFQAANIQATIQLVRMTLFSINANRDVRQKCDVAEQVLSAFHSICPAFLRAISTPLVYHLGAIGRVLASAAEGVLTEDTYQRIRGLLISMADLLQGLEFTLQPMVGASKGLRMQVDKIDQYMHAQRRQMNEMYRSQQPLHSSNPMGMTDLGTSSMGPPANTQMNGFAPRATQEEFQLPPDLLGDWPWQWDLQQDPNSMNFGMNGFSGFNTFG